MEMEDRNPVLSTYKVSARENERLWGVWGWEVK